VSGSLTRSTHFGNRGSGHGDTSFGSGSGFCCHRHNDAQRQFSARSTSFARKAFRSTSRETTKKWSSSWISPLLSEKYPLASYRA